MKLGTITLNIKSPDAISQCVDDFVRDSLPDVDEEEREAIEEIRKEKVGKAMSKFVKWGEYVNIRIDLDKGTAEVLPA